MIGSILTSAGVFDSKSRTIGYLRMRPAIEDRLAVLLLDQVECDGTGEAAGEWRRWR